VIPYEPYPRLECGPDCGAFLAKWAPWWRERLLAPRAMLFHQEWNDYLQWVGKKSRNMARKATERYAYGTFDRSAHLDAIWDINTSKPERQGKPMTLSYQLYPEATTPWRLCDVHRDEWWGAFDEDERLRAYVQLIVLGRLGIVNKAMGHAHARGAMNGMFAILATEADVDGIHYLDLRCNEGLANFKRSVGFVEVGVV